MTPEEDEVGARTLSAEQIAALLTTVFVVSVCGLSYELMMGALATTLLGSSITWFSLTIGVFLSSMGVGSWCSRFLRGDLLVTFVIIEVVLGFVGGLSGVVVFAAYAYTPWVLPAIFGMLSILGILVGLELPILTRFLQPVGGLRTAIANVMALDYLGALVASLAFPFIMMPWLGLLSSFFAVGILNLIAAGLTLIAFPEGLPRKRIGAAILGGIALLTGGLINAERTMSTFERILYADTVIHVEQTPYQRVVLTKRSDDLRLYIDGHLQFAARDEFRYHEALVHPAMLHAPSHRRVLLLGAGDGLAAREVFTFDGVEKVVLVDLDPAITTLARTQPQLVALNGNSLADPRIEVINADAFTWLVEGADTFDVIIADFPDPHDDGLAKLYSTVMYQLVRKHLSPGGVAVTQASSPYFARRAYWTIHDTIVSTGMNALPYHVYVPAFGDWGFVLYSANPVSWDRITARPDARFLTAPQLRAAADFPPDVAYIPSEPSTLDHPRVAEHYRDGWDAWF